VPFDQSVDDSAVSQWRSKMEMGHLSGPMTHGHYIISFYAWD